MFMKCPHCGSSRVRSIESDGIDAVNSGVGQVLRFEHMRHHSHPIMQLAHLGVSLGRAVYRRVPGGGLKRCDDCGSEFR